VIKNNLGLYLSPFPKYDHGLKLSTKNCDQTAADKDIITTDSL